MAGFDSRLCRKHGPGDEEVAAGGAPGGVAVCLCFPPLREIRRGVLQCAFRRSASPHFSRGGKLKAHLARRRENAGAWLFDIVDRKFAAPFPGRDAARSSCGALLRRTGIAQNAALCTAPALQRTASRCAASGERAAFYCAGTYLPSFTVRRMRARSSRP